ncbi:MAG: hypothetical protein Q8Q09_20775 [Deltaproteobacteria bacterium]|nr:hypothetical protein [Deltaproteobacteria bacterium]
MRWSVDLPAQSGGTGATVTVNAESWKSALHEARGGTVLSKFRVDFDEDQSVRVYDLLTNERFVLRPTVPATEPAQPIAAVAQPLSTPASQPAIVAAVPVPATNVQPSTSQSMAAVAPSSVVPPPPGARILSRPPATPISDRQAGSVPPPQASSFAAAPPAAAPPKSLALRAPEAPPVAPALDLSLRVLPPAAILFARDREAANNNGLTYRERVLVVPPDTSPVTCSEVLNDLWRLTRDSLVDLPKGKFISLAIFDHAFSSRPERPPLMVLEWKDWRSDTPVVSIPAGPARPSAASLEPRESLIGTPSPSFVPPAPAAAPLAIPAPAPLPVFAPVIADAPTPAVTPVFAEVPIQVAAQPVAPPAAPVVHSASPDVARTPAISPVPSTPPPAVPTHTVAFGTLPQDVLAVLTPAAPSHPPAAPPQPPDPSPPVSPSVAPAASLTPFVAPAAQIIQTPAAAPKKRHTDDLLSEAFEALQDLAFLRESSEAIEFVSQICRDLLATSFVAIASYDINRDELELAQCDSAPTRAGARILVQRSDFRGAAAVRGRVERTSTWQPDEWLPTAPDGPAMIASVMHDRRLFGLIELHRTTSDDPFDAAEESAIAYIAQQLGDFLATHSRRVGFQDPTANAQPKARR